MGLFHQPIAEILLTILVVTFVLEPFSVLCHELGHARVALRVSAPHPVGVVVGYGTPAVTVTFERLTIRFSPVINQRGTFIRGFCRWNSKSVNGRDRLRVILAGPIATALLLPVYCLAAWFTRGAPHWIPASFAVAAFGCVISLLINLDVREKRILGKVHPSAQRRDGIQARNAYRQMRAGL